MMDVIRVQEAKGVVNHIHMSAITTVTVLEDGVQVFIVEQEWKHYSGEAKDQFLQQYYAIIDPPTRTTIETLVDDAPLLTEKELRAVASDLIEVRP